MADTKTSALSDGGNIQATDQVPVNRGGTNARVVVTKAALGLGNVENTAVSTFAGTANIVTVGTVATGTWGATTVAVNKGGTGQTSYTDGQLLIGNTSGNTLTKAALTAGTNVTITNGNGSITIASTGGTTGSNTQDAFTGDGSTVAFTLSGTPASSKAVVSVNGVVQRPTTDYGISSTTLTFTSAPANSSNVLAFYSAPAGGAGGGDALTTNPLSQFAATTSAQLRGVLSDETGTGVAVFATSPTLVTPLLGTPTSGTLTSCIGLPVSTGISGLGTGVATFMATPSSANLATAVTDETGSGALVFATSPTLVTPVLGTPSSGNLSSCTADGTNAVGIRTVPVNNKSAAYTTVLTDSGQGIDHPATDANARTFTIDSNANVAYPVGACISFSNMTSQVVTIAITSDTMYLASAGTTGSRSLAQYGTATARKLTSTTWLISGTGLT